MVFMHLHGGGNAVIERSFLRDFGQEVEPPPQPRADALRDLGTGCQILVDLGLRDLRLLTSSTRPIVGVEAYGLHVAERVPLAPGGE